MFFCLHEQSAKARLRVQEDELKKLQWEHEVLRQRFEQTQKERDELYNKFVRAIHEVQQKGNFKNLLLEKKLTVITETLEKKVKRQAIYKRFFMSRPFFISVAAFLKMLRCY